MMRLEENGMVINEMIKREKSKQNGTYEEIVTFQLGVIATMLTDISKSLAILADKLESGYKKGYEDGETDTLKKSICKVEESRKEYMKGFNAGYEEGKKARDKE